MSEVDPNPVMPRRRGSRVVRAVDLVATTGCASLLVFVALRVLHLDDSSVVATLQSLTPYVLLPAWLALGWAAARRRRVLAAAGLAGAAFQLAWLLPEARAAVPLDAAAQAAPGLRVFSANVFAANPHPDRIVAEVLASDADVVLLQEYDDDARRAFAAAGGLDRYPYVVENRRNDPFGSLIASRLPVLVSEIRTVGTVPVPVAVIDTAIGPVSFVSVHTRRPVTSSEYPGWVADHEALAALVRARTMPCVIAGDFNATTSHRPFRELLAAGVVDSHRARGAGLQNSWPNHLPGPALLRIDHVLTTTEIVARSVRNGRGDGSDHVPMMVDLALVGER
jgi:endonuclease/exonuclease/phosphatase (EEP) superfamily protein YafD